MFFFKLTTSSATVSCYGSRIGNTLAGDLLRRVNICLIPIFP